MRRAAAVSGEIIFWYTVFSGCAPKRRPMIGSGSGFDSGSGSGFDASGGVSSLAAAAAADCGVGVAIFRRVPLLALPLLFLVVAQGRVNARVSCGSPRHRYW